MEAWLQSGGRGESVGVTSFHTMVEAPISISPTHTSPRRLEPLSRPPITAMVVEESASAVCLNLADGADESPLGVDSFDQDAAMEGIPAWVDEEGMGVSLRRYVSDSWQSGDVRPPYTTYTHSDNLVKLWNTRGQGLLARSDTRTTFQSPVRREWTLMSFVLLLPLWVDTPPNVTMMKSSVHSEMGGGA